jgi:hypothetical protein
MGTLQILKFRELFFKGKHRVKFELIAVCPVSFLIKMYNLVRHTRLNAQFCVSDTNNSMNYVSFFCDGLATVTVVI